MPYGMLLTRLFKHVMTISHGVLDYYYDLHDRVMYPFTAQQERNTQKDYGTKRGRHSTSSSFTFGQPSSSHLNDDNDDGNSKGTSRAITPSLTRFVNSLANEIEEIRWTEYPKEGILYTRKALSMVSFGRISPNRFLSSILLVVVIIITVVIVVVILVVVIFAIVEVVIVVVGVPSKIIDLPWQQLCFQAAVKSAAYSVDELDNVVEEEDEEWIRFLGGNSSSGIKKYRGLNSNDGGNTRDGVKIAGGVIGSGDEIEFSKELKELLSDEAEK
ncbi:hypothetical protein Tco_0522140 [Tanacetum coccineum]